ncbi:MAG: prolipoprotein diacylglyceryl transferase, partial [Mogibacterium sp.]|nr:prolipoprotein diacylglyceryl transferase [Mogibacterium sp.]
TFSLYCIFYSLERFLVESLRTDSLMIGPFRQAQVISICAIILGIFLYRYVSVNRRIETPEKQ